MQSSDSFTADIVRRTIFQFVQVDLDMIEIFRIGHVAVQIEFICKPTTKYKNVYDCIYSIVVCL